jgi:hypothetical protein
MVGSDCVERAQERLSEEEPDASVRVRNSVAREMCRLLERGKLEQDLDRNDVGLEYLISRFDVRDGADNPELKTKWNTWIGEMHFIEEGGYNRHQI